LTSQHELAFEELINDRKLTAALQCKLYIISILASVTQKH